MFLPIEVLQGLTYGLFYSTMATYASVVALPGTEATMQAMVSAAFEGLGMLFHVLNSTSLGNITL